MGFHIFLQEDLKSDGVPGVQAYQPSSRFKIGKPHDRDHENGIAISRGGEGMNSFLPCLFYDFLLTGKGNLPTFTLSLLV